MTDMIAGTRVPNTEAGVQAFARSILKQERDRVQRNFARSVGNYKSDLEAAHRVLDNIDLAFGLEAEEVSAAMDAVSKAQRIGFVQSEVTLPLQAVRDAIANIGASLATSAIALDTIISNIQNGESE